MFSEMVFAILSRDPDFVADMSELLLGSTCSAERVTFPWWRMQTVFSFSEEGVPRTAMAMECVKVSIVPNGG